MTRPANGRTDCSSSRGSALIVSMIVMAVLAIIAVSAVRLSTQGVINTSRKVAYDELVACANAAQQKVLTEMALNNAVGTVTATGVPGGPMLGLGHYDDPITVTLSPANSGQLPPGSNSTTSLVASLSETNALRGNTSPGGLGTRRIMAHCTDSKGRQQEVELIVNVGL